MRYEVYADRLFFLHFGMNFLLLVMTAKLGGYRSAYRHLAAAAALGSAVFLGVLLMPAGNGGAAVAAKAALIAVGGIGMLYAAFGRGAGKGQNRNVGKKTAGAAKGKRASGRAAAEPAADIAVKAKAVCGIVAEAAALYMASACALGGALLAAGGIGAGHGGGAEKGGGGLRVLLPAVCASAGGLWLFAGMKRRRKNPFWEAELREGEQHVRVTALLDSGNGLYDPVSARPVCIVEKEVLERLSLFGRPEGFRLIPYHSIGKEHGLLYASVVEEMYLQKGGQRVKREKVLLAASDRALSGTGRYQMLLHPALLEETKGANHDIESSNAGKDAV